jgi:hypothetical protein
VCKKCALIVKRYLFIIHGYAQNVPLAIVGVACLRNQHRLGQRMKSPSPGPDQDSSSRRENQETGPRVSVA